MTAESEVRRINEELAIENSRLVEIDDGLRDQVQAQESRINELEWGWEHHDCSRALDEPQPVFADMSDDTVSVADRVVCYVRMYRERGDPSVGIGDTAFLTAVRSPDPSQPGLLEQVTGGLDVQVSEDVRELAVRVLARYAVQNIRTMLGEGRDRGPDAFEVLSTLGEFLWDSDRHGQGIGYGEVVKAAEGLLDVKPLEVVK